MRFPTGAPGPLSFLLAVALLAPLAARADTVLRPVAARAAFQTVPFDEAMSGQIVRSLPLQLAFPGHYQKRELGGVKGVVWADPADLEEMLQSGRIPARGGVFRGRLTASIGYDSGKSAFICGAACDEADLLDNLRKMGAENVRARKQTVNGIPVQLIEADSANIPRAARSKIYVAHIATLIDSNVFAISYVPPVDSADAGAAAWQAFTAALLTSSEASAAPPAAEPGFADYLAQSKRSRAFRPAVDVFIAAVRFGDAFTGFELVSPNLVAKAGRDVVQNNLASQVLPFFADFAALGGSVTIGPATDSFGSTGFVFHMTMRTKQGGERPFSIYVVEEKGEKVIANVLVDYDFRTSRK